MLDIPKLILDLLKLAPRYFVALAMIASALLFLPEGALQYMDLLEFTKHYRAVIYLALISSACILLASFLAKASAWSRDWFGSIESRRDIKEALCSLSEDEKDILRLYIGGKVKTHYLHASDRVVKMLVAKGVLIPFANGLFAGNVRPHSIAKVARNYLKKRHRLLMPKPPAERARPWLGE